MHRTISLKSISLQFAKKNCFENFSAQIYPGSRIAVIGKNGSGKTSLLHILRGSLSPSSGEVSVRDDMTIGYVEQTIQGFDELSGGQRFNKRLSEALAMSPDLLLLDEPTNHLDEENRKSLMRMLRGYQGTLIVVTHDTELLRNCIDILWHIDHNKINVFSGSYENYMHQIKQSRLLIEKQRSKLARDKKAMHHDLMKEQQRAASSKARGKKNIGQRKWPTIVSRAKANRATLTSGKKKSAIETKKQYLADQLSCLSLPEMIVPTFSLTSEDCGDHHLLSIQNADIGYNRDKWVIKNLSLSLYGKERIAVCGNNASGKSTLLRAILGQKEVLTTGDWSLPHVKYIGYLDQHYSNLDTSLNVIEHVRELRADWHESVVRRHLSDFLFRTDEDVLKLSVNLSGGEKARLLLCLIAAKTPRLLILDEITNNLDIETKEHMVQVLREYPGAMIVVSHERDFLNAVGIDCVYNIKDGSIKREE